mmetsp:Transcript_18112/g.45495  ORF Transcript_18112/g.45495 Transcript_18112/m.45495 type:complete len:386 (-) Transcript_18112:726-1883(-)
MGYAGLGEAHRRGLRQKLPRLGHPYLVHPGGAVVVAAPHGAVVLVEHLVAARGVVHRQQPLPARADHQAVAHEGAAAAEHHLRLAPRQAQVGAVQPAHVGGALPHHRPLAGVHQEHLARVGVVPQHRVLCRAVRVERDHAGLAPRAVCDRPHQQPADHDADPRHALHAVKPRRQHVPVGQRDNGGRVRLLPRAARRLHVRHVRPRAVRARRADEAVHELLRAAVLHVAAPPAAVRLCAQVLRRQRVGHVHHVCCRWAAVELRLHPLHQRHALAVRADHLGVVRLGAQTSQARGAVAGGGALVRQPCAVAGVLQERPPHGLVALQGRESPDGDGPPQEGRACRQGGSLRARGGGGVRGGGGGGGGVAAMAGQQPGNSGEASQAAWP